MTNKKLREELKKQWEENQDEFSPVIDCNGNIISQKYIMKNNKRDKIRKEYRKTFSKNKRLAIYLVYNFSDKVFVSDELLYFEAENNFNSLEENWNGKLHKKYLEKADKLLDILDEKKVYEILELIK